MRRLTLFFNAKSLKSDVSVIFTAQLDLRRPHLHSHTWLVAAVWDGQV